jgi:hypothetical protein
MHISGAVIQAVGVTKKGKPWASVDGVMCSLSDGQQVTKGQIIKSGEIRASSFKNESGAWVNQHQLIVLE